MITEKKEKKHEMNTPKKTTRLKNISKKVSDITEHLREVIGLMFMNIETLDEEKGVNTRKQSTRNREKTGEIWEIEQAEGKKLLKKEKKEKKKK